MLNQAHELNVRARMHEALGNALLASWMHASAEHHRQVQLRTDRALDQMSLGAYGDTRRSARIEYARGWYAYEEEYAYNFNGLE